MMYRLISIYCPNCGTHIFLEESNDKISGICSKCGTTVSMKGEIIQKIPKYHKMVTLEYISPNNEETSKNLTKEIIQNRIDEYKGLLNRMILDKSISKSDYSRLKREYEVKINVLDWALKVIK